MHFEHVTVATSLLMISLQVVFATISRSLNIDADKLLRIKALDQNALMSITGGYLLQ